MSPSQAVSTFLSFHTGATALPLPVSRGHHSIWLGRVPLHQQGECVVFISKGTPFIFSFSSTLISGTPSSSRWIPHFLSGDLRSHFPPVLLVPKPHLTSHLGHTCYGEKSVFFFCLFVFSPRGPSSTKSKKELQSRKRREMGPPVGGVGSDQIFTSGHERVAVKFLNKNNNKRGSLHLMDMFTINVNSPNSSIKLICIELNFNIY